MAGAEQIAFIGCACLEAGQNVIIRIFFGEIENIKFGSACLQSLFLKSFEFVILADIAGNSDDFAVVVVFLEPGDDDRCIQTAAVSEYDFFDIFLIHIVFSSSFL